MRLELQAGYTNLDPKLQFYLDQRVRGRVPPATASTVAGEIAVIAKVSDLTSWLSRTEVFAGAGKNLTSDQIRDIVAKTARSKPPAIAWDPRYGRGRVDASAAVEAVQNL